MTCPGRLKRMGKVPERRRRIAREGHQEKYNRWIGLLILEMRGVSWAASLKKSRMLISPTKNLHALRDFVEVTQIKSKASISTHWREEELLQRALVKTTQLPHTLKLVALLLQGNTKYLQATASLSQRNLRSLLLKVRKNANHLPVFFLKTTWKAMFLTFRSKINLFQKYLTQHTKRLLSEQQTFERAMISIKFRDS